MKFEGRNVSGDEFKEKVSKIFTYMEGLLAEKNRMYGGASFELGLPGVYVHLVDKMNRVKTLINLLSEDAQDKIAFEGLDGTLQDLIGYSVIGLIILEEFQKSGRTETASADFNHQLKHLAEERK